MLFLCMYCYFVWSTGGNQVWEMWFKLNCVKLWFNPIEFALITGLIFEHNIKVSNYVDCAEQSQLKEEYFSGIHKLLTYLDIKNAIETQIWGDNDENVVKFATLYLMFLRLLGVNNKNVIYDHFLWRS